MKYSDILHPGLTRYHHISLLIPLLFALSPMVLGRLPLGDLAYHHRAFVYGALVVGLSYGLMLLLREPEAYPKAVLLGLLVAEFTVFGAAQATPSIINIALFVFLYMYAISKIH